jgi:hypothetical protein
MFKKLLSILFFMLLFGFSFATHKLIDTNLNGHYVKVIEVKLDNNTKIVTSISESWDTLENLKNKVGGISAINGAYFMPKDYWFEKNDTNAPRFYEWKNYSKYWTDFGTNGVFSFDKNWNPFMVMNNLYAEKPTWTYKDWKYNEDKIGDIYYGIWNFPVLLKWWKSFVEYYGNYITDKMKLKATKAFICYTKDKKIVYMGYISKISMLDLPYYIKANFGCWDAINLDAGWSLGLIYKNKVIHKERRKIMDAFVVIEDTKKIELKTNLLSNKTIKSYYNFIEKKYSHKLNSFSKRKIKLTLEKIDKFLESIKNDKKYSKNTKELYKNVLLALKVSLYDRM